MNLNIIPVEWTDEGVRMLDQRLLPTEEKWLLLRSYEDVAAGIKDMVVRGAPAIGVSAAYGIALGANQFVGTIPSLAGFASLKSFLVADNRLTGSIPSLDGLDALKSFDVGSNQLTGPIPALTGHVALVSFVVTGNALTGSIPDLTGLSSLAYFFANRNRLEGSIPPLAALTALQQFFVSDNVLTGTIPELPPGLLRIDVGNNRLSGAVPAAPPSLWANMSRLCPNPLNCARSDNDAGWNVATGHTPWWADPVMGAACDDLFGAGFEAP